MLSLVKKKLGMLMLEEAFPSNNLGCSGKVLLDQSFCTFLGFVGYTTVASLNLENCIRIR